jgi:hypothetical protein
MNYSRKEQTEIEDDPDYAISGAVFVKADECTKILPS